MTDLKGRTKNDRQNQKAVNELPKAALTGGNIQPIQDGLDRSFENLGDELATSLQHHAINRKQHIQSFVDQLAPIFNGDFDRKILAEELEKFQLAKSEGKDSAFFLSKSRDILAGYLSNGADSVDVVASVLPALEPSENV